MRLSRSRFAFVKTLVLAAIFCMAGTLAHGQGSVAAPLSGAVVDSSGGVIPGADVTVKNNATSAVSSAVTGTDGTFTIPALQPGTYTVTVSLMGFKTWTAPDVVINAATPASVKVTLEVGNLQESIVVEGAAQLVQTQTSAIANTINAKQITNLPLPGRAAFDFVALIPGVTSSDGSTRGATVNGLPQSLVNITLDGMNIQDNYAKTWDGMFTRVSPRLDAVEEVTVGTAAQGADMAGQGGVQVRFVTRSGTNDYRGSLYYYFRREWMNSNTWFNLNRNVDPSGKVTAKPVMVQYQPGGRLGGPIIKDKAFFFINYEDVRSPGTITSTRTIMSPSSEKGIFQYGNGQKVDLMALAAKNGQIASMDPTVANLLGDIRKSTDQGYVNPTSDPLTQTLSWQQPSHSVTHYPTIRLDYNVSSRHRLTASLTQNHLVSDPDTTNNMQTVFPGFSVHGLQDSYRWSGQLTMRSTLSANMVNEVRLGGTGGATYFSPDLTADMYGGDQNGYAMNISAFKSISSPYYTNGNASHSAREASTRVVEDTLNWIRKSHSLSIGGSWTQADVWAWNQQVAPTISFGMQTGDPASSMFSQANFPGASTTDLTNAKNLYALLTGRITSIGREARISEDGSQYVVLGPSMAKGRLQQIGAYVQDSWRWRPDFTVNAGLRYDVQLPFYSLNNSYSAASMNSIFGITGTGSGFVPGSLVSDLGNMFQPGVLQGAAPTYSLLSADTYGYNTDWNNLAPSIGVAWRLGAATGVRHLLLGDDGVVRAGYNIAYQRGGMNDFTQVYGANPGVQITASTRSATNGNLGANPLLLSSGNLGPGTFTATRTYPMAVPSASSSVYAFDPNIKLPYATSLQVGVQRAITKSTVVEARFVHTGSHGTWTLGNLSMLNYNEIDITNNGFLNEFRTAQANLQANLATVNPATGKPYGATFAYTGAPGTSPLPIFLAYLNGAANAKAGDPKQYSGNAWTDSALVSSLYPLNPNPCCSSTTSAAGILRWTSAYGKNAVNAGLAPNFFVVNPDVSGAYVATNGPDTRYNGAQLVLTRRFARGLQLQANYSFGRGYQYAFYSFLKPYVEQEQNYSNAGGGNATGNIRHMFTANWVYELPFGQGKRFGGGVGRMMNRVIGNWSYMGTARMQSGRLIDFGNVRLVGMTKDDVANMIQLRLVTDPNNQYRTLVYSLPQDVVDNTVKAFNVTATGYSSLGAPSGRYFAPANGPDCIETAVGYGDCAARSVVITGPTVVRFDMSLGKQVPITARVNVEFQVQVFNVFNRVNFSPVNPGTSPIVSGGWSASDNYQITNAVDQSRTGQLAFRISW